MIDNETLGELTEMEAQILRMAEDREAAAVSVVLAMKAKAERRGFVPNALGCDRCHGFPGMVRGGVRLCCACFLAESEGGGS